MSAAAAAARSRRTFVWRATSRSASRARSAAARVGSGMVTCRRARVARLRNTGCHPFAPGAAAAAGGPIRAAPRAEAATSP